MIDPSIGAPGARIDDFFTEERIPSTLNAAEREVREA
jgi:hypothetical protein